MPTNAIRIYVKYEKLFLAELRALLQDIERAYNRIDSAVAESQRVRRRRRLIVEVFRTGQSIEAILIGSIVGVSLLRKVISEAIKMKHDYYGAEEQKWKAHEQKWKAKDAEQKFLTTGKARPEQDETEKLEFVLRNDPRIEEAKKIIESRIIRIQHSRTIQTAEVSIGDAADFRKQE